jgi:hypothetical protein
MPGSVAPGETDDWHVTSAVRRWLSVGSFHPAAISRISHTAGSKLQRRDDSQCSPMNHPSLATTAGSGYMIMKH